MTQKTMQEILDEYNEILAELSNRRKDLDAARAKLPKIKGREGVMAELTDGGSIRLSRDNSHPFSLTLDDAIHISKWILKNTSTEEEDYRWTT